MPNSSSGCAGGKTTMAERVWLQLAAEIVSGGVSGGRRLDEVEQSNRLGVSRTPLRESLRQLAALGLVENRPHRGVVVADGVGPSLFQVLAELESACARSTALLLTGAQCRELALIEPEHQLLMPWLRNACGNSIMRSLLNTLWYPLLADTARHGGAGRAGLSVPVARRGGRRQCSGCRSGGAGLCRAVGQAGLGLIRPGPRPAPAGHRPRSWSGRRTG